MAKKPAKPAAAAAAKIQAAKTHTPESQAMWGGRFAAGPSGLMEDINASIDVDKRLAAQDIAGSRAHAAMLRARGLLSDADAAAIARGLDAIEAEIAEERFPFSRTLEDIHMNIEARLADLIGPAAGRLHMARSRNDQVALDFRLFVRDWIDRQNGELRALQAALLDQAEAHAATVMPGLTHLQTAQPVTFGHHCLAYVEMFGRDRGRLADARARLNECPLGAAALAGTAFPIDREHTAGALGFDGPTRNSIDSVSDRDFALEAMAAAAISSVHLSRLAEEIVVWCSAPFGFIRLPDHLSTGSSIMPQKRNPDAAELVRAKSGRIIGALNTLLIVLKGLPLAYAKDMQEDKEAAFDAFDSLSLCVRAMTAIMAGLTVNAEAMRAAAMQGFSTATDLADWLVRELDMPFRAAHHAAGRLVAMAEGKGVDLTGLALEDMQSVEPRITEDVFSVLSVERSVASRVSFGGTGLERVREQIAWWRARLAQQ